MRMSLPFIAYPSVGRHAVIGDRRTAALVAADGTVDWLCLPDYDGAPFLGVLLDVDRGGYWRLGPRALTQGRQTYAEASSVAVTTWETADGTLEVTDFMPWPQNRRPEGDEPRRALVRRIRCVRGRVAAVSRLRVRPDYGAAGRARLPDGCWLFHAGRHTLGLWATFAMEAIGPGADGLNESIGVELELREGEEHWAMLGLEEMPSEWSVQKARRALEETLAYWRAWDGRLMNARGPRAERMRRSGMAIHLMSFAPDGSLVAAPTNSLPERIGGPRNYDYRYAWVRDASLSVFGLAKLGDQESATRYLDWLAHLPTDSEMPIQVMYRITGETHIPEVERKDILGYRESGPVRVGNRAYQQVQVGALGYLADCALAHLEGGGDWQEEYWQLVTRAADYVAGHWREKDNGIWELPHKEHFLSSKVMSWVVLDRAIAIGERTGRGREVARWRAVREEIHREALERGWSSRRQAFTQCYGAEALDASALLMVVTGFLPPEDERVRATIARIEENLVIEELVYRFEPVGISDENSKRLPLGEFEGTFFPCTFWLATAYAMSGELGKAEAILRRAERLTNDCDLFAEEADPRTEEMIGNYPLLFSQVEYLRALLALDEAKNRRAEGRMSLAGSR